MISPLTSTSTQGAQYLLPQGYHTGRMSTPPLGPGMGKTRESTRTSSRRRMGSAGPAVVLGLRPAEASGSGSGSRGLDVEGMVESQAPRRTPSPNAMYTSSHAPPYLAPPTHFPVQFNSPTSPSFPVSSLPQQQQLQPQPQSQPSMSSRRPSKGPVIIHRGTESTNSLSTTASTSSRTLKTPQSKLDQFHQTPAIASSSSHGSHEGQYSSPTPGMLKPREEPRSPTPTQRSQGQAEGRRSSEKDRAVRDRGPPPALVHSPLPPTPPSAKTSSPGRPGASSQPIKARSNGRPRHPPPAPLDMKKDNRLSQDWVSIPLSEGKGMSTSPIDSPPIVAYNRKGKLPAAQMIPMKNASPQRPVFERAQSEPLSPSEGRDETYQKPGRGSLDRLRSNSPTPVRMKGGSMSTPPAVMLESAASSSDNARSHPFRMATPSSSARKSEDVIRSSADMLRPKKDVQKEQQRSLGVASTVTPPAPEVNERKSSGLSLKKSSGALKALFSRGASGKKDRVETPTPPMPSNEERARAMMNGRPSIGDAPRRSFNVLREERPVTGRSSSSAEGTLLFPGKDAMQRTASAGTHPVMNSLPVRLRIPSRDLPPLPPPSPTVPVQAETLEPSPTKSSHSTLAEALPSSSLPYLSSLRASVVIDDSQLHPSLTAATPPSSSTSTAQPSPPSRSISDTATPPFLASSKSLHLLQLPDLDLDFGSAFDSIGLSPSTPRRISPIKHRQSPVASPQRSQTIRATKLSPSPRLSRRNSERRRSRSFDGVGVAGPGTFLSDVWGSSGFGSPDMTRLFASSSSSSAPVLREPLEPSPLPPVPTTTVPEVRKQPKHAHKRSLESQPSSSDHARTPSNASSTNETLSPSPPRTPELRNPPKLNIEFDTPPSLPTLTPITLDNTIIAGKPFLLNQTIEPSPSLTAPPTIPLPDTPGTRARLEPPAEIAVIVEPIKSDKSDIRGARENKVVLGSKTREVKPSLGVSLQGLAKEIEKVLYTYRYPPGGLGDRAAIVRNEFLPLLQEVDARSYDVKEDISWYAIREKCFEWAELFLLELVVEQAANERGACLEGLAGVMESSCLSERALQVVSAHKQRFSGLMMRCMGFVMGKLGAKGVFHNTLLFSGRFLAFAFFRVPHIGEQLVTVLQPPRGALQRFTMGAFEGSDIPASALPQYPSHLSPICFDNSRAYTSRLASLSAEFATEEERDAYQFQPGNWLRRWQSDDSELFPAFYGSYHRQLANYLTPAIQYYESLDRPLPASLLLRAPGYAHLATIFAKKCHSYIQGSVNAVTTSSSSSGFDAMESAGLRGSQKPQVLETANRRLVETLSTFANTRVVIPSNTPGECARECEGQQLWSSMLNLWTKSLVSRTNLYAPKGVFSLFDLLDGIVDPPPDPFTGERRLTATSLLDIPHLIYTIRLILTQGEHALTLVKVIAFVFTHWEVLTSRPEDRRELCLSLFLERDLFERLLLFWSQSVRSYVLRLVVFRLGHLHTTKGDGLAHEVEIESVKLLQTRLDRIKKRHDELEPKEGVPSPIGEEPFLSPLFSDSSTSPGLPRSRSTITMINDSPQRSSQSVNKAEKLLGLGFGAGVGEKGGEVIGHDGGKMGKATNWLKKSFGGKQRKRGSGSNSPSPTLDVSPTLGSGLSPSSSDVSGSKKSPRPSLDEPIRLHSPVLPSPSTGSSVESTSPTFERAHKAKQGPPPIITTTSASPSPSSIPAMNSPPAFKFEFELPTMSPRSDAFDPIAVAPPSPHRSSGNSNRNSQPPSPRQPASPHMSRSFSKRSSLLPPSTANALEREETVKRASSGGVRREKEKVEVVEKGYEKRLHAYAIRMLAELEDAQKEYDEWWSEGGVGKVDGSPPRLTVAWPFHEGED